MADNDDDVVYDYVPKGACLDTHVQYNKEDKYVNCPTTKVSEEYAKAAKTAAGGRKSRKMRRHSTNKRKVRRNKKSKTTRRKRSHK